MVTENKLRQVVKFEELMSNGVHQKFVMVPFTPEDFKDFMELLDKIEEENKYSHKGTANFDLLLDTIQTFKDVDEALKEKKDFVFEVLIKEGETE